MFRSKPADRVSARGDTVGLKMKLVGSKAYYALSFFLIGAVHLLIARQATKPVMREVQLTLVKNEFLDKPPTKIVVVGDHNSGQDFAYEILSKAFGKKMVVLHENIYRHELLDAEELNEVASRTDILWVVAVRSACDFADRTIAQQKVLCNAKELPLSQCGHEFASDADHYRRPWHDWQDNRTMSGFEDDSVIIESIPEQSSEFDDIFDMRQTKLRLMKQVMDSVARHVKILRTREFELNPNALVTDIVKEYKFTITNGYKKLDEKSSAENAKLFRCMELNEWKEAQQRIDWTIEGYFGYGRYDCHLCRESALGRETTVSPSKIYLLGERNSGTTFVSNTLANGFEPPNTIGSDLEKFSSDVPVLLHKHMFRHDLLNQDEIDEIRRRDDILWIMVVRSPCDWAEGMFRKPYHFCSPRKPEMCGPKSDPKKKIWLNQNHMLGIKLIEFFTTVQWADWAESVPFLRDGGEEEEEVSISKVSANYTYPNVWALRRHKLSIMKQIIETVPRNIKFVRLKEFEKYPELLMQGIVKEFNMTVKENYEAQPPSLVTHSTVCLTPEEWVAAQDQIDWELEAEFGFSPFDCRMCYGYNKSKRLYDRVMGGKKKNEITSVKDVAKKQKDGGQKKVSRVRARSVQGRERRKRGKSQGTKS